MRTSFILFLALAGCSETQLVQKDGLVSDVDSGAEPDITVDPSSINFGSVDVSSGEPIVQVVTVTNDGDAALELHNLTLQDASAPYTLSAFGQVLLQPGESTQFTVTFDPTTADATSTKVLIDNNDPDENPSLVDIQGAGIAPAIQLDPSVYDFGTLYIGCGSTIAMNVNNVGNADLVVSGFDYVTASDTELAYDADLGTNGPLPWTIPAGSAKAIYLSYDPLDTYHDEGYLTVHSNDPLQPDAQAHQTGAGNEYGQNLDVYEQPTRGMTDIVFTLDWSGSMDDNIAQVQSNFDTFLATLVDMDADYQVAVIVGDDGCVLTEDRPYISSTMSADLQQDGFTTMIGSAMNAGGYTEMGFTLLEAAMSEDNLGSGGCNEGMLREDATLAVVGVTDEPEQSLNPWDYYVTFLQSQKSDPDKVIVHAIAGDYPSGCGSAEPGHGWYEASVATGGLFLSICATDWASHLEALAEGSAANLTRFELTSAPVPETIRVTINGVPSTVGWTFDETANTVVFDDDHVPEGGSTIEIEYSLLGDCDG